MSALTTTVEAVIALLASAQHGVVTRLQLLRAGVTRHQIPHRISGEGGSTRRTARSTGASPVTAVPRTLIDLAADVPSALERRFLALLQEAGLPLPQTNRPAGAHHVDCRWPDRRLTIELDSYRFHHSRHAWEQDRRRERAARAGGDELRRYTWADVFEEPDQMLAELRRLLG